ncbi:MAG: hypothetical protein HC904_05580 [Blastochloris sp.]|nr:hypothetical protein [Blastochloris sp.]
MEIRVLNGTTPLVNAPVTLSVVGAGERLAYAQAGVPNVYSSVTLRTNQDGVAKMDQSGHAQDLYLKLPDTPQTQVQVLVTLPNRVEPTATFVATSTEIDTDGDGMPDSWELANGTDPSVDDSLADLDGDRFPNIFEYHHGTTASDPLSKPEADFTVASSGAVTQRFKRLSVLPLSPTRSLRSKPGPMKNVYLPGRRRVRYCFLAN